MSIFIRRNAARLAAIVIVYGLVVVGRAQSTFEFSSGFGESGFGRDSNYLGGTAGHISMTKVTRNGVATTYVVGPYSRFGDASTPLVATFDGIDFGPTVPPPFVSVYSSVSFDDGNGEKLYVSAFVAQGVGTEVEAVFSFDGTTWTQIGVNLDLQTPAKLAVFDTGNGPELVCAGVDSIGASLIAFVPTPGTPVPSKIVHFSGGQWMPLGTPTLPMVDCMDLAIHDDGQGVALYGAFRNYQTTFPLPTTTLESSRVFRLTAGQWTQYGPAIPGPAPSAPQTGGVRVMSSINFGSTSKLVIGGELMPTASQLLEVTATSFIPIGPISGTINAIAAFGQGSERKLVVGGDFLLSTPSGPVQSVASWNGAGWEPLGTVAIQLGVALLAESDAGGMERLVIIGHPLGVFGGGSSVARFLTFDGVNTTTYARNGADGAVLALASYDDGGGAKLYAGGTFTKVGLTFMSRLAFWNGAHWTPVGTGANGMVSALAPWADGPTSSLAVGGNFSIVNGVATRGLALLTGSTVSSIGDVLKGTGTGNVYSIASFDDGTGPALYIGGDFTSVAGVACNGLARRKNGVWSSVGAGLAHAGFPPIVYALEVHDFGSGPILVIGGDFDGANAGPLSRGLMTWNGTSYAGCAGGVTGGAPIVYALESYFDGQSNRLVLGGDFDGAGGVATNAIAAWDGAAYSAFANGIEPQSSVGTRFVTALASIDEVGGRALIVGGYFTGALGVASSGIIRYKNGQWFDMENGISGSAFPNVAALAVYDDGYCESVFAGGSFGTAGSRVSLNLAAWRPTSSHAACDLLGPAADGQIGLAIGGPFPILRVNGSSGRQHRVVAPMNQPIQISVLNPTTPFASGFAIFGLLREATTSDAVTLPLGFGMSAFTPCPLDPANPELFVVTDSLGIQGCVPVYGPVLAPWVANFPGIGFPFTLTIQGLAVDPTATLGLALTNAIIVKVR